MHFETGGAHYTAGRLQAAEAEFRASLASAPADPTVLYALGITLLAQGRYSEGLPLFELRHSVPQLANHKPPLPYPEWTGGPVAGQQVVIWPEQGLGDQIQAARFAPILKAMGAHVTLICAPALVRLFGSLGVEIVAAQGAISFPDPDGWLMCMSLPHRLGLVLETLPGGPYLPAGVARVGSDRLRIGVSTRGNPNHVNDAARSLPGAAAARLAALPADIVDLDPAKTGARDFQDTAEIIRDLDLVISVDTAVAHLAGAMGQACWLLLPAHNTDWRWMRDRSDSPWYGAMRLFRQPQPGDWTMVIEDVEGALAALSSAP